MITKQQLKELATTNQISEYVVAREFLQLILLKEIYQENFSRDIFFKGGTCLRLIDGGYRFSEDLDFTVEIDEKDFSDLLEDFFERLQTKYPIQIKKKKAIAGLTYLATVGLEALEQKVHIKLDFSFREGVVQPTMKIVRDNEYPIVFSSFIHCLSIDEILSEKVRAMLMRSKYRDIYDIWLLLNLGAKFSRELVDRKLEYYEIKYMDGDIGKRVEQLSAEEFEKEMKPFVPKSEREKLKEFFEYIKKYISTKNL